MLVCTYNQVGFCKYRDQCVEKHANEVCPQHPSCEEQKCESRHPRFCRTFGQYGHCKFTNCAYTHRQDQRRTKVESLTKEVGELRDSLKTLLKTYDGLKLLVVKYENKSEYRDKRTIKEINDLKETIKDLSTLCKDLKYANNIVQKDTPFEGDNKVSEQNIKVKVNQMKCTICDYKCTKELTMKKHINTKHSNKSYDCSNCHELFQSQTVLKRHMENKHKAEPKSDTVEPSKSEPIVPKRSLCDDAFNSVEEYTDHINTHLDKIQGIDIEDLKNGHESFGCSMCKFNSNDPETVKRHLTEHALKPKQKPKEDNTMKLLPNKLIMV